MCDSQCIHPNTPATPLIFDSMVKQNSKNGIHHLSYLLLLRSLGIKTAKRKHPLLPNGALQQTPAKYTLFNKISKYVLEIHMQDSLILHIQDYITDFAEQRCLMRLTRTPCYVLCAAYLHTYMHKVSHLTSYFLCCY